MKTSKLLALIALFVLSFGLMACNKQATKTQSNSLIDELMKPRPSLDKNKDYSADLSGHWSWTAINSKTKKEIGKGQFLFLEKPDKIFGLNKIESGMETILPRNVQIKDVSSVYLNGGRDKSLSGGVQFHIEGNGLSIDNVANLSDKGHSLKGHGFSILEGKGGIINGKFAEVEYEWSAVRTTG